MRFRRFAFAAGLVAASTPAAYGAGGERADQGAGPASTVTIAYELFIMGLPLGSIDVSARIQGGSYQAQSTLDTKGLISIFWQAHIEAQSQGRLGSAGFKPAMYDSHSRHRDRRQHVTVTYGPNGPESVVAIPPYSAKYPVTEEQRRNTVDPLSAMVYVATGVSADAANPCGTAAPVYDGRRRYDIQLIYLRTKDIVMDNGAYKGPALVCQIKYIQIAGFKQKIIEEGKRLPQMYAWIVPMPGKTDPSRRFLIPIRLWAETNWGTAEAEISRLQLDSQVVAQERR